MRMSLMIAALLAAFGWAATAGIAATPDSTTTILVVRHAEKDTLMLGSDPRLSAAGTLRARELARVLADAGISTIYSTAWQRNRLTAMPLATQLGDTLTIIDAVDATVAALRHHRGETVLVVGHSNTVPQIIEQLTGVKILAFTEGDYDRLYVVTLAPGRPGRLLSLRYGAPKR